eukprot:554889-Hanusia_phi.AAC.8
MDPCDDSDFFKGVACSGTLLGSDRKVPSPSPPSPSPPSRPLTPPPQRPPSHLFLHLHHHNQTRPPRFPPRPPAPPYFCLFLLIILLLLLRHHQDIAVNALDGVIPECVGQMQNLTSVDLRSNRLTGSIPSSFGSLPLLQNVSEEIEQCLDWHGTITIAVSFCCRTIV